MLTGYNHIYIYITVCNQQHDNVDGHSPAPTGAGIGPSTDWLACQKNGIPPKKDRLNDKPSVVLIIAKNGPSIDDIK